MSKANFPLNILSGAVGAIVIIFLAIFIGYKTLDISFLKTASCSEGNGIIYCFFDKKWDSETYLSVITSFYSTIITILIALLGVVAGLAYIVIRGSTLQRAEEAIEKEVDRYFETSKAEEKIHKGIEKVGNIELEKIKRSLDEIRVSLIEAEIITDGNLELENEKETKKAD